jgi:hypothetical protein
MCLPLLHQHIGRTLPRLFVCCKNVLACSLLFSTITTPRGNASIVQHRYPPNVLDRRQSYAPYLAVFSARVSSMMGSPKYTSPCPTSPSKRPRDSSEDGHSQSRSPLTQHIEDTSSDDDSTRSANPVTISVKSGGDRTIDGTDRTEEENLLLTKRQHRLLISWYEDFAHLSVAPSLSDEPMIAFAAAIQARSKTVIDCVRQWRNSIDTEEHTTSVEGEDQDSPRSDGTDYNNTESYTLAGANSHLPPLALNLIDKYISACRRRRSPNDGRRSVNTGPYRCTFDCGYRTKRAFDWRRHEETHEPQELWLCCICSQNDIVNPFLVNRKDKFLKHAADKHTGSRAETILDKSKLAFVPRAELGCRYCEEESGNWDERCRHVLGHFEDEVERGTKRVKVAETQRDVDETTTGN